MKVVIQNPALIGHIEFRVETQKDLEMLILLTPILLLKRSTLW